MNRQQETTKITALYERLSRDDVIAMAKVAAIVILLGFTLYGEVKARKMREKRDVENVLGKEQAAKSAQKPSDGIPVFAHKITPLFTRAF